MMIEDRVLDELRAWFEVHKNPLAGDGYQVEFAESPSDRSKQSASLTISSASSGLRTASSSLAARSISANNAFGGGDVPGTAGRAFGGPE